MTDDLPFLVPEPDPTRPERPPRKCWKHQWVERVPRESVMSIAEAIDADGVASRFACSRCGRVRDEAVAKRNKRNRQRGGAFERTVAKQLGGRKTGPLGGRDDVMVGGLFSVQTKRAARFALTEARTYLDDLRRTYPTRTPIVVHALPGERGGVVILTLADWVLLHGSDGQEAARRYRPCCQPPTFGSDVTPLLRADEDPSMGVTFYVWATGKRDAEEKGKELLLARYVGEALTIQYAEAERFPAGKDYRVNWRVTVYSTWSVSDD